MSEKQQKICECEFKPAPIRMVGGGDMVLDVCEKCDKTKDFDYSVFAPKLEDARQIVVLGQICE